MSNITNISITSEMSPPMHCSTLKANSEDEDVILCSTNGTNKEVTLESKETMNNLKSKSNIIPDLNLIKINNSSNLVKLKNDNSCAGKLENKNEHKLPRLHLVTTNSVQDVVNDLSKVQSAIIERNSTEFVMTEKVKHASTLDKPKHNKPIMGCSALLQKAALERNDSLIIHDLITDKYNDVLNHYYGRMYQRRQSRTSASEGDASDTIYSSPPDDSPLSFSSMNTSNRMPHEKNGFHFPNTVDSSDCKFILSTDNTNIETTIEDLEEISTNPIDTGNEKSTINISEYDPKKFLKNAIGEITNISDESGICKSVAEENNQPDEHSIGTTDISLLVSRASSLYTSMKNNIKKRCSTGISEIALSMHPIKDKQLLSASKNALLEKLMKELSRQNEIMFQVSKALNYCRTTNKFEASRELIEAEKILLLASCTKDALNQEIQNIQDEAYEEIDDLRSSGEVELSNLKFLPKDIQKTGSHQDFTEHFLAILICGTMVQASDVVEASENGDVYIDKSFKFTKLPTDFEISLCIYSLKIGHKVHQNQEQKNNCPSVKRIFSHLHRDSKKYKILNDASYLAPSCFFLWGKCEIRSHELSKLKKDYSQSKLTLKMYNIPLSSTLSGIFSLNMKSEVKLVNKINGFLTIGTENEHGCTIWNRRWCLLEGFILKYWNYPSEEVAKPLGFIDLSYCLDQAICPADRSICARPKTLMLSIQYKQSTKKKYLLTADSLSEMKQWEMELNYVIQSLKVWNCMNVNNNFQK